MRNLFFITILLFTSCTPIVLLPTAQYRSIPKGSSKIIIESTSTADSLIFQIHKSFANNGWPVKSDDKYLTIQNTDGKSVGRGTSCYFVISVSSVGDGSRATMQGEYGMDAEGQVAYSAFGGMGQNTSKSKVVFNAGYYKGDICFQEFVKILSAIPGCTLKYEK